MFDPDEVGIAAKVAFLRRADVYPIPTRTVEVIETHMSWVFLTDSRVYKLKKPVRRDHFELGSVAARHRNCENELDLNRRLAPDVYLGLIPLALTAHDALALGAPGRVVDWLVEMRRLERSQLLDVAIRAGTVDRTRLAALAQLLAEFYRQALRVTLTADAYRARCIAGIDDSVRALTAPRAPLDRARINDIAATLSRHVRIHAADFAARVAAARIVEGHGDLRPEHVCLESRPLVIDCLEFDRDLRIVDVADELAYLALECEHLGAAWVGDGVLAACCALAADAPPARLVEFYKAARALLRAKLCIGHLDDLAPPAHARWIERATAYVALASRHAQALATSASSALAGPPGRPRH